MAKDLLDFSKFKKIFEDEKNTHLRHPKGHTIIVAHVALSPKLKKQIADLPMHPEKMVEVAKDLMEHLPHKMAEGGSVEKPAVSRVNMHYKDVTKRVPQLTEAANKILSGEMSSAEYDALVNKHKPVEAYGFVPQPATREEAVKALGKKSEKYGKTGHIDVGHPTELRLDIPSYRDHGVWINSIHPLKPDNKRDETVYDSVSSVKNAKMIGAPTKAIKVASGEANKSPFAVIRGDWNPIKEEEAVAKAQKYLKHPEWRQVGYDPERHGYFYDRETMHPIESAEEVLQIGPLVLAKKPVYGKKHEQLFANGGDVEMYAKGGATARKAAKEYDWNAPAGSQDLWRETPASMFNKKGKKINKETERSRAFGDDANAPRISPERMKMMNIIRQKVKDEYGVGLRTAAGKRTETGEIRDEGVQPPYDVYTPEGHEAEQKYFAEQRAINPKFKRIDPKPDWDNPDKFMDTQPSPDAGIHEVAHARQIPIGMTLAEHQNMMDRLQGQVQKEYGFLQNKRTSHEVQPMAMENAIRRELGLPANSSVATGEAHRYVVDPEALAEHNAVRTSPVHLSGKKIGKPRRPLPALETNEEGIPLTHDTKEPMYVAGLDHKGNVVYYMRQSRLMNPENRQRTEDIRQKVIKYHPERGMVQSESPNALINLRAQGRADEAERILRTRGPKIPGVDRFAEGGQVGYDAIKKERYYADGGRVMYPYGGVVSDTGVDPDLEASQFGQFGATPEPTPAPETLQAAPPSYQSSEQRPEVTIPQRFHRQNIIQTESGGRHFDTTGAPTTGTSGEIGASQIMPEMAPRFAQQTGVEWNPELFYRRKTGDYAKDQEAERYNLDLGAKAFEHLYDKYKGDIAKTIAAYNTGEPNLNAAIEKAQREGGSWLDHVAPSTRRYVYENLAREEGVPNPHEFATKKAGMAPEEAVEGGTAPSAAATSPTAPYAEGEFRPGVSAPSHAGAPKELRQSAADQEFRRQVGTFYNQELARSSMAMDDYGMALSRESDFFGPNGEPPPNIDPDLYARSQNKAISQFTEKTQQQQQEIDRAQKLNQARAQAGAPLLPVPGAPKSPLAGTKMEESPIAQQLMGGQGPSTGEVDTKSGMTDLLGPESNYAKGQAMQVEGTKQMYKAAQGLAQAAKPVMEQSVIDRQNLYMKTMAMQQQLENYHQKITNMILDKEIDPMRVWNNKSVPAKIASVIGMMLSGMGSGVTKQENAAYKVLKDQIDLDVEAQKANLGRLDNLLKVNNQAMQYTQAGAEVLRAQLGEVVVQQLKEKAQQYEGTRLEGDMQDKIGKIYQNLVTQPLQKAAFMKLAYSPSTTESQLDQMLPQVQALFPDLYEDIVKRRVPGYGVATRRPLTLDEQNQIKSSNTFIKNAQKLERLVNEYKYKIALNLLPSEEKETAISMMAGLASDLAKAHGAEPSEGIMKWLEKQLGSPTSIKDAIWTKQAKLGATIEEMKGRKEANLSQAFPENVVRSLMHRDEINTPEYAPTTTESKEAFKRQLSAPPRR